MAEQQPRFGIEPAHSLRLADLDGGEVEHHLGMAEPHSFFLVKGWSRMFAAYTVLLCCFEKEEFIQARDAGSILLSIKC